jgi:hypothetical protein
MARQVGYAECSGAVSQWTRYVSLRALCVLQWGSAGAICPFCTVFAIDRARLVWGFSGSMFFDLYILEGFCVMPACARASSRATHPCPGLTAGLSKDRQTPFQLHY